MANAKSLEQLKIDTKNNGWPWPITHPNDERALVDGCYPDFQAAERVRRFFKKCLFLPNEGGGTKPFHLLDWWYRDVLAQLFGWKRADGRRRFQKGFITTAKKSGKSTVLAGLPLYMMFADGEEEAEVYSAAVDRDQASIVFAKTLRAIRLSPHLKKIFRAIESQKKIMHDASGSKYEAISSDADSTEGKNPHSLIADEIHVWRDRQFFDSLMYGDIVRVQPMFLMITTAGDDEQTVGFEEYQAAKALLDPNDPFYIQSTFAFIAEASDPSAWDKPESWLEAQPSLRGEVDLLRPREDDDLPATPVVLGSLEKLQKSADEAKQTPRRVRKLIRYICNRWVTEAEDTWLDPDAWDACGGKIPDHSGEACWLTLDLSSVVDFTALCMAFWRDETLDLIWKFWYPKDNLKQRETELKVPLRDWAQRGFITLTPGPSVDYRYVRSEISGAQFNPDGSKKPDKRDGCIADRYDVQELAYDPWHANELCNNELGEQDGMPVVEFRQTMAFMAEPTKTFERMLLAHQICHGDNPVATWMARHVVCSHDDSGNFKPSRKKSRYKIDGIVTGVMAVGRAVANAGNNSGYWNPADGVTV